MGERMIAGANIVLEINGAFENKEEATKCIHMKDQIGIAFLCVFSKRGI